jgi:hypothetical protein
MTARSRDQRGERWAGARHDQGVPVRRPAITLVGALLVVVADATLREQPIRVRRAATGLPASLPCPRLRVLQAERRLTVVSLVVPSLAVPRAADGQGAVTGEKGMAEFPRLRRHHRPVRLSSRAASGQVSTGCGARQSGIPAASSRPEHNETARAARSKP